ncbi:DNA-binding response regulator [Sulfuriferula plumbiphila]|uniref:DNA-binding response regulator n=1 Tax=Sulfuriferula plumbiphila TaxID=171865 RepID=A0A512LB29_9PROT|nr:response regulator transcription factor [Sulfuriferula plumbiphila]BBP03894.1 DNA-binding response regulator [Sulfuriferula plumbiphila]GEP31683.1 DNA-binding response regulator [Sulfuriferula plumbiphila]
MSLRVMLVDDHKLLRDALHYLLNMEGDIDVVGETGDGQDALDLAARVHPDIVIMDIGMPGINGIETTRQLIAQQPDVKVIALSAYTDRHFVEEMLNAGASGYVSKAAAGDELLRAIRAMEKNEPYFCPEILMALMTSMRKSQYSAELRFPTILTPREREVLCLLAEGKRSSEIAWELFIAVSTVDVHRRNIMNKLDLHNIAELTKYAIREGLIQA